MERNKRGGTGTRSNAVRERERMGGSEGWHSQSGNFISYLAALYSRTFCLFAAILYAFYPTYLQLDSHVGQPMDDAVPTTNGKGTSPDMKPVNRFLPIAHESLTHARAMQFR